MVRGLLPDALDLQQFGPASREERPVSEFVNGVETADTAGAVQPARAWA